MDGYMRISEVAELWGISTRRVTILCQQGRIDGASKFGNVWAIPDTAQKPADRRVKSGKYRNWRHKEEIE